MYCGLVLLSFCLRLTYCSISLTGIATHQFNHRFLSATTPVFSITSYVIGLRNRLTLSNCALGLRSPQFETMHTTEGKH